jgi:hypothetical protein
MRFNLQVVGDIDTIKKTLESLVKQIQNKTIESNETDCLTYDYDFVDCNKLYEADSFCKVVQPFKKKS